MKKLILFVLFIQFGLLVAQNGRMIIPSEISEETAREMKEMGMNMSVDDIYNPNNQSMNDAVVQFNGGCTAELISPNGLLLTNHHCGYSAIQSHSSVEHNYIKDGFWSKSMKEELPNPGMYVTFVRKIRDVTHLVMDEINENADENIKQSQIQKRIDKLQKTLPKEAWQEIEISAFYDGNKFYAFTIENYKDIRFVGAPPSSVGKFGADTDNWMWPRHSGDFSMFRIYADEHNHPAEYSPDNRPYKSTSYFKISLKGVQPKDFFLVYGFPGRTNEFLPAVAVNQKVNVINPARVKTRETALNVMMAFMKKNEKIKLQYTAKYARISNYWKKWIGESLGIKKSGALDKKKAFEKEFLKQVKAKKTDSSYLTIFDEFDKLYKESESAELARNYFIEIGYLSNALLRRAFDVYQLERTNEKKGKEAFNIKKKKLEKSVGGSFKNYNADLDKELFKALIKLYVEKMPEKYLTESFKSLDVDELATKIYRESVLNNQQDLKKLYRKNPKKFTKIIGEDEGYKFAKEMIDMFYQKISPDYSSARNKINRLQRKYMKGIIETREKAPYPDANGTLRISYGIVDGYQPGDAVYYYPVSHLSGVMEKYVPGDYEFDVSEKLIRLYKNKDYKPYSNTGKMSVDFLGSAHTTGGNSGSPAIDKDGNLIGINFDRVWEGTMSDLYYDQKICRNIMVDIRYVLFIIDKMGADKRLIDEMDIVK